MKRNDEKKSRNEKRSFNDNTGFGMDLVRFISHDVGKGLGIGELFSQFNPRQYTMSKTHAVVNHAARPVLKDVNVELGTANKLTTKIQSSTY